MPVAGAPDHCGRSVILLFSDAFLGAGSHASLRQNAACPPTKESSHATSAGSPVAGPTEGGGAGQDRTTNLGVRAKGKEMTGSLLGMGFCHAECILSYMVPSPSTSTTPERVLSARLVCRRLNWRHARSRSSASTVAQRAIVCNPLLAQTGES